MFIYLVIAFFLFIYRKEYKNKNLGYVFMLILLLLAALRGEHVGNDTERYIDTYVYDSFIGFEYVYTWLCDILRLLKIRAHGYIIITACLSLIPIYLFIKRETVLVVFSILIFFCITGDFGYFLTLCLIRQSLALGVVLVGFMIFEKIAEDRLPKRKKIILCVVAVGAFVIAFGLHNSSIICLPICILAFFVNFKKDTWTILIGVAFILSLVLNLNSYLTFLDTLETTDLGDMANKYSNYQDRQDVRGLVARFYLSFPIAFIALFSIHKDMYKDYLVRLFYIGSILLMLCNGLPIVIRSFIYFVIIQIIIWPNCYRRLTTKNEKLIFNLGLVLLMVMFVYDNYRLYMIYQSTHQPINCIPYEFFFQ